MQYPGQSHHAGYILSDKIIYKNNSADVVGHRKYTIGIVYEICLRICLR